MKNETKTSLGTMATALVVDDDPVLSIALQQFVARTGFHCLTARNGKEALTRFHESPPDVILMDAAMPVMDGFQASQAIRKDDSNSDVPIIMITGYDDEQSVDRAFAAGANDFITKPIHWAVLRHRMVQLVEKYHAERDLRNEQAFLQSVVDTVQEPLVVLDERGITRWVNQSAASARFTQGNETGAPFRFTSGVSAVNAADDADLEEHLKRLVINESRQQTLLLSCASESEETRYAELIANPLYGHRDQAKGVIIVLHDVTARELKERTLAKQATEFKSMARHDELTELPNRRLLQDRLGMALSEHASAHSSVKVAVLYIDLDGFKAVNDQFGHDGGDEVLIDAGNRLRGAVRKDDLVARIGGDEFCVLLENARSARDAERVASKIIDALGDPFAVCNDKASLGASIGISLFPDDADSSDELLKHADEAMYAVKCSGKGNYQLYRGLSAS